MLYVPGSDAAKLAKVGSVGADAYILDLEDAVAPSAKRGGPRARRAGGRRARDERERLGPCQPGAERAARGRPAGGRAARPRRRRAAEGRAAGRRPRIDAMLGLLEDERGLGRGSVALIPTIESVGGLAAIDAIATAARAHPLPRPRRRRPEPRAGLDWPPPGGLSPTIIAAKVEVVFASAPPASSRRTTASSRTSATAKGCAPRPSARARSGSTASTRSTPRRSSRSTRSSRRATRRSRRRGGLDAFERGIGAGIGGVHIDGRFIDQPVAEHARRVLASARRPPAA